MTAEGIGLPTWPNHPIQRQALPARTCTRRDDGCSAATHKADLIRLPHALLKVGLRALKPWHWQWHRSRGGLGWPTWSNRPMHRQALPARTCARRNDGCSAAARAANSAAALNWRSMRAAAAQLAGLAATSGAKSAAALYASNAPCRDSRYASRTLPTYHGHRQYQSTQCPLQNEAGMHQKQYQSTPNWRSIEAAYVFEPRLIPSKRPHYLLILSGPQIQEEFHNERETG